MAKESQTLSFSKSMITIDDKTGDFIIEETVKEGINVYNLTNKLKEYCGIEGLSIRINKDAELVSEE